MTATQNLAKELKALGMEMASAMKKMKDSQEFKKLEKDLAFGIKSISSSLGKALMAAQKSKETAKIKKRLKKVVTVGAKEGKVQVIKAEAVAAQKIKQAAKAVRNIAAKIREHQAHK